MMCEMRKGCGGNRVGILIILVGLLWMAQRLAWFPPGLFGPLLLLMVGGWVTIVHHLLRRASETNENRREGYENE
jgi:hypothetical protein